MRTLSGQKLKTIGKATKRDTYFLNGVEISRVQASSLVLDFTGHEVPFLSALALRDITPASAPIQTVEGLFWHELIPTTAA